MRELHLTGRVVADATTKLTDTGRQILEFRFANNEYKDKDKTYWYRVNSFEPRLVALAKYITKGKPLIVVGDYSDNIYKRNDGTMEIGRDILATAIYFVDFTNKDENGQQTNGSGNANANTSTAAAPQASAPKKKDELPPAPKEVETDTSAQAAPSGSEDGEDDLPF